MDLILAKKESTIPKGDFSPKISDYSIFQGNPADLNPNSDFKFYELTSTLLFSAYAEKCNNILFEKLHTVVKQKH